MSFISLKRKAKKKPPNFFFDFWTAEVFTDVPFHTVTLFVVIVHYVYWETLVYDPIFTPLAALNELEVYNCINIISIFFDEFRNNLSRYDKIYWYDWDLNLSLLEKNISYFILKESCEFAQIFHDWLQDYLHNQKIYTAAHPNFHSRGYHNSIEGRESLKFFLHTINERMSIWKYNKAPENFTFFLLKLK